LRGERRQRRRHHFAKIDLVMKANGMPVDLGEVVPAALAPFTAQGDPRIRIEGPPLTLREHTTGGIALNVASTDRRMPKTEEIPAFDATGKKAKKMVGLGFV